MGKGAGGLLRMELGVLVNVAMMWEVNIHIEIYYNKIDINIIWKLSVPLLARGWTCLHHKTPLGASILAPGCQCITNLCLQVAFLPDADLS